LTVDEAVLGQPAPPLRPFVEFYSGYRQAGVEAAVHRGLPSPYLTVIFTLYEPLVVTQHPDPRQPAEAYLSLAGGLHTSPALITHDGWQSGIQLAVSPLGARALLGVPAGELAIIDVDGSDVLGSLAREVCERIRAAVSWPDRFAVLDEVLCARLAAAKRTVRPEITCSWQRLLETGGALPVSALADETGWSDRYLRSAFAAEVGLTPKAAARVIRFHQARRLLQQRAVAGRPLDIAGVAARGGYYDQAHLDLEFRALAGVSPSRWVVEEFRNFQALERAGQPG
jgi:AraC-like DNA-binding protein